MTVCNQWCSVHQKNCAAKIGFELVEAMKKLEELHDDSGCQPSVRDCVLCEVLRHMPQETATECSCGGVAPFHYDRCPVKSASKGGSDGS